MVERNETGMLKNKANERDCTMNSEVASMVMAGGCRPCMPSCPPSCGCTCPPVTECPCEQVCHRVINYEVPHIMPYHTTIVNHHVYNHTYTPVYSYSEVDEVENIYQNRCCN